MSIINILTCLEAICKKYDTYAIDKQKDLNISSSDAFAHLYSVVESTLLISVCDDKMAFRKAVVGPVAASTLGRDALSHMGTLLLVSVTQLCVDLLEIAEIHSKSTKDNVLDVPGEIANESGGWSSEQPLGILPHQIQGPLSQYSQNTYLLVTLRTVVVQPVAAL
ncbi:hypothetical protein NE237_031273 [Protea cynaroides]|uniref:Uncharacterized protein n=1 Tax=Protea cynaroides TaxID=273540 RepID=A0A9Q0L241_9MAGN|nr:hypothetical protein NE237_031273 [Protea cynaroides]